MASGRNKCVIKYDELINRIRKTFYFGGTGGVEDIISLPLASYASELFSKSHRDYSLNRLSTYNACKIQASPCSLIMALIFLERLNATDPSYVRRITPHELFIVSMMISTKFYIGLDEEIYLSDWALEGNMTEDKLKQLELEFLCAIDWNIYISNEEFFEKLGNVEKSLAQCEGIRRGWLTYTELMQVMPSPTITKRLLNALFNHIAVMIVSYAAGVLTIVGAFFLASQIPGHILHRSSRVGTAVTISTDGIAADVTDSTQMAVNNETDSTVNATSITTVLAQHNATCNALNVEAELSKLERRYKEEQEAEELLGRNNELNHVSYSMISIDTRQQSRTPMKYTKQEHKWLSFKETYSDRNGYNSKVDDNRTKHQREHTNQAIQGKSQYLYDCFKNFGNCSSSLFWQIMSDSAQGSFGPLPLLWFKFM